MNPTLQTGDPLHPTNADVAQTVSSINQQVAPTPVALPVGVIGAQTPQPQNSAYATPVSAPAPTAAPTTPKPATASTGSTDPYQQQYESMAKELGYPDAATMLQSIFAKPSRSTEQIYNDAYKAAGLDALQSEITQRKNDLATKLAAINDNPWLDEANRVGRSRTLQQLADANIKNLVDEYNSKLATVHDLVTRHADDLAAEDKNSQLKLSFLEKMASQNAAEQAAQQKVTDAATAKTTAQTKPFSAGGFIYQWNPKTNTYDQIGQARSTAAAKTTTATGTNGSAIGDPTFWAQFYGSGGKQELPALGMGTVAANAKQEIMKGVAKWAQTLGLTGTQFAAISADKAAAKQSLNKIAQNEGMMSVAEGTASKNFDMITSLLPSLPTKTISPLLNQFIQKGEIVAGNANLKPVAAAITNALNEYAKVITGQTSGAAVSDAARREAQTMMDVSDNTQSILNFIKVAKQEMGNRVSAYSDAKQNLFGRIMNPTGDVQGVGNSGSTTTGKTSSGMGYTIIK